MSRFFQPAAVFGDHMVLGRNRPIRVFGEATDGALLTASLSGNEAQAHAVNGRFVCTLPPMQASGPHTLTLSDGHTAFTFEDVYIGEVYLAGGQSNMEMKLRESLDGPRFAQQTDLPLMRYYNAPRNAYITQYFTAKLPTRKAESG